MHSSANDTHRSVVDARGIHQATQTVKTLFLKTNTMADNTKRRETCFGDAWSKLQKMGFTQKARLPRCTDVLLSTSHGPGTPHIPSMSSSSCLNDPRRAAGIPKVSMNADEGPHVFTSSTPYLDDQLYVDPPDGKCRGLVRMKRVARRRPVICSVVLPQREGRLFGQPEAPGDFAAEFRRYIEASVVETTKDQEQEQLPSPSPVGGGDWEEMKNVILALEGDPLIKNRFIQAKSGVDRRPPLHSRETSKLVMDGPALCNGYSPVIPEELDVNFDGVPERIQCILDRTNNDSASRNARADTDCAPPLHEDVVRVYQALRESEALPDYFNDSRRGVT
ncbi:hypothetical protein BS17DRAFT_783054 [Gyrodon lividus]|nr:hypothetical protein BS17DRAFT_783054 [Gyrodon lividus]